MFYIYIYIYIIVNMEGVGHHTALLANCSATQLPGDHLQQRAAGEPAGRRTATAAISEGGEDEVFVGVRVGTARSNERSVAYVLPSSPLRAVWRFVAAGSSGSAEGKPPKAAAGSSFWSNTGSTMVCGLGKSCEHIGLRAAAIGARAGVRGSGREPPSAFSPN
jgi:hypothetical protein